MQFFIELTMELNGEPCLLIFQPGRRTVYSYYRKWVKKGVWETINAMLLERVRTTAGRAAQPSLAMVDSQSVKQAQKGGKSKDSMDIKRLKDASAISWSM